MSQEIQDFKIRYGKPSDFEAILSKVTTVIGHLYPEDQVDKDKIRVLFDKSMENTEFSLIVLVDKEDKLRGYIFACLAPLYFHSKIVATCMSVWVDNDCRGHSLDMLRAFESWGRYRGADTLSISEFENLTPHGTSKVLSYFGYNLKEKTYWKEL